MSKHLFPYEWNLSDGFPTKGIEKNNKKVFGTFICGGGSTMGYKLAGYNHIGGVEIDKKVADVYLTNHNPKHLYIQDIREFNKREDLPKELHELDILDGSPPCSSFSMEGNRESDWGKEKQFTEGQAFQVLDDLVFEYCNTIEKLQPKVAILENVKGLIQGNAKNYVIEIMKKLKSSGYKAQLFLLNAASMGVPQKRERVFFIIRKESLNFPDIKLNFNEVGITFNKIEDTTDLTENIIPSLIPYYHLVKKGASFSTVHPKGHYFNSNKSNPLSVLPTITADEKGSLHYKIKRNLNKKENCLAGTYPKDYDFKKIKPKYLIGMSVPPVMTAQIANQIYIQWLSKL